jgi:hypothetical protein
VAGYVRVGWLATPASRPCLICLEPAQVWHHPSYRRGHHATVQPLCLPCHNECHQIAWRQLMAETWLDWTFCTPDARPEVREQAHAIWREL